MDEEFAELFARDEQQASSTSEELSPGSPKSLFRLRLMPNVDAIEGSVEDDLYKRTDDLPSAKGLVIQTGETPKLSYLSGLSDGERKLFIKQYDTQKQRIEGFVIEHQNAAQGHAANVTEANEAVRKHKKQVEDLERQLALAERLRDDAQALADKESELQRKAEEGKISSLFLQTNVPLLNRFSPLYSFPYTRRGHPVGKGPSRARALLRCAGHAQRHLGELPKTDAIRLARYARRGFATPGIRQRAQL